MPPSCRAAIRPAAEPAQIRTAPAPAKGNRMSQPTNSATVQQVEAEQLYEIQVDGRRAGVVAYRDHGDQRVFYHTEVDDAYAGQGLASRLVREALTESRGQGKRIVPVCPYVA